jgi:hypothetical protein
MIGPARSPWVQREDRESLARKVLASVRSPGFVSQLGRGPQPSFPELCTASKTA